MKVGALRKGPRNGPWSTSMGTGGVGNTWPKMCPPMLNQMLPEEFQSSEDSDATDDSRATEDLVDSTDTDDMEMVD